MLGASVLCVEYQRLYIFKPYQLIYYLGRHIQNTVGRYLTSGYVAEAFYELLGSHLERYALLYGFFMSTSVLSLYVQSSPAAVIFIVITFYVDTV